MAKKIAIINHKGGVGKTITTMSLGAALKEKGYKVLLIDIDAQANLTLGLGVSNELEKNIYQAMRGNIPLPIVTNPDGLDIVPSCLDMAAIEMEIIQAFAREQILAKLIRPIEKDYDYILIDCPPSLSILTVNALAVADGIIIPMDPEYFSSQGMGALTRIIQDVQQALNPKLELTGILVTKFDGRKRLNQDTLEVVKDIFKEKVFDTVIRNNVSLGEAAAARCDILHYAPRSTGATDYRALCEEFLKREKN